MTSSRSYVRRAALSLVILVLFPAVGRLVQVQDAHSANDDIRVRTYQNGTLKASAKGAFACPSNVPVGETAVAFDGEVTTTNEQGVSYEVEIRYASVTAGGALEHIGLATSLGAWNVSVGSLEASLLLSTLVTPGAPLQWAASLLATQAGTVAYTFETRLNGNVTRTETCTFDVVEPNGAIRGQVAFNDPTEGTTGVNGMTVTLLDGAGNVLDTQETRSMDLDLDGVIDPATERGLFLFANLPPGTYRVRVEDHEPWEPVDVSEQDVDVPPGGIAAPGFGVTPGTPGSTAFPALDFGDLPTPHPNDTAVCPNAMGGDQCYQTLVKDDGARHGVRRDLHLGFDIDVESDGDPDRSALNDRFDDGVSYGFWPLNGGTAELAFLVRNDTPFPAYLYAWLDFNNNGQLGDAPEEHIVAGAVIPPLVGLFSFQTTFPVPPFPSFDPYLRVRLTTDVFAAAGMDPFGLYFDGEVEDYEWLEFSFVSGGDFGDAPDTFDPTRPDIPAGYPTRYQDDGARHIVIDEDTFTATPIFLGRYIDLDPDGQPTVEAEGDDTDLGLANDDDGIVFDAGFTVVSAIPHPKAAGGMFFRYGTTPGALATIIPLASTDGRLDAWFDWNRDGDWDDPGEQVFDSVPVQGAPDYTPLTVAVPTNAAIGYTFSRFRFSLDGDLDVTGLAPDGEVEDYLLQILDPHAVTTTDDSGAGSLRQLLTDANANTGRDLIDLRGLGKQGITIALQSPLPAIIDPVILVGGGTIVLDGSGAGANADGLTLDADGSVVSGLTLSGFSGHGIVLGGDGHLLHGNVVTGNGGDGIRVLGTGNTLLGNAITDNGGLGIDHGGDGPTSNDATESDGVPNFPVIASVDATDSTRIAGALTSTPEVTFTVEFFENPSCDAGGHGEGATPIGTAGVTTDAAGQVAFTVALERLLPRGRVVTATATGPDGSTSEFSQCLTATDVASPERDHLARFRLHANYPNPFNPTTRLVFDLPEAARVGVEVIDVLGRVVWTLTPQPVEAGAGRTLDLNASALPSGTYLYRITAEGAVQVYRATGRIVLVK